MQVVPSAETKVEAERSYGGGDFLVLYDGVCGLCNRSVQFILRRDRQNRFRYAPLQSRLAAEVLARHGQNPEDLNTFYLIVDPGGPKESALFKSRGILRALRELGGFWRVVSWLGILPTPILDWVYDRVAINRYRWFGRFDACPMPSPEDRAKFLDL